VGGAIELDEADEVVGANELDEADEVEGASGLDEADEVMGANELDEADEVVGANELEEADEVGGANIIWLSCLIQNISNPDKFIRNKISTYSSEIQPIDAGPTDRIRVRNTDNNINKRSTRNLKVKNPKIFNNVGKCS
jgi:hypothetical protein